MSAFSLAVWLEATYQYALYVQGAKAMPMSRAEWLDMVAIGIWASIIGRMPEQ